MLKSRIFGLRAVVPAVALAVCSSAHAQTYTQDFSTSDLGGPELHGDAVVTGGFLRLTQAVNGVAGSMVIGGGKISSFTASFTYLFTYGFTPTADGVSFNLGRLPDDIDGSIAWENGPGNGLTVGFDIFDFDGNGFPLSDYGARLIVNGTVIASAPDAMTTADRNAARPITIHLDPDGTIDVTYNGNPVFTNVATGYVPDASHRFGIAARTGGEHSEQRIDDLSITATAMSEDLCRNAAPVHGDGLAWFNTTGFTTDGVSNGLCTSVNGVDQISKDAWFCWTATQAGVATVRTTGLATFDTFLAGYRDCAACPTGLGILACNDDSGGTQSLVNFRVQSGSRYLVRIGGYLGSGLGGDSGSGALSFSTLADCPADYNHSGIVSVQDIFDFLAGYFAGCP